MVPRWVVTVGALVVAFGAAMGLVRYLNGGSLQRGVEGAVASLAFAAVLAAPGIAALLARRGRPALLLPAAVILVPLSFLSFAGVLLPLLVPAVLLFRAYRRDGGGIGQAVCTTATVLALLLAAVMVLFASENPRSSATESTSDVITYAEAAASLALVAGALAGGWVQAAPARPG
jgi:hypothetical protein